MSVEILEMRKNMWSEVSGRKHVYRCYGSPDSVTTYLLEGEVVYTFKSGGNRLVRWIAKADFDGEETERKLNFYQVFLNAGSR